MYSGFGSKLNGSPQMRARSSAKQGIGARNNASWNKGNRGGAMQRGRGRGSNMSQQSIRPIKQEVSPLISPIKTEPGVRGEELQNSGQSNQNSGGSDASSTAPPLSIPIKEEPGLELKINSEQCSEIERIVPSSTELAQDEAGVGQNESNSLAEADAQTISKPSTSSPLPKSADGERKLEKVNVVDETPKQTFICHDCEVTCTSQVSFNQHLTGKRHKTQQYEKRQKKANMAAVKHKTKSLPMQTIGPLKGGLLRKATPLPGSSMKSVLRLLCQTEDVVGMQYVTEYRKLGTTQYRYLCELCDNVCSMNEMVEHLVSRKHRMRYARIHLFSAYARMTDYPSFANMLLPTQVDQFLARLCARVVNADVARGMRHLKAKQYINEADIGIDVSVFSSMGKQHPSMIEDLIIAENILEEADSISKTSQIQLPSLMGPSPVRHGSLRTKLSEYDRVDAIVQKSPLIRTKLSEYDRVDAIVQKSPLIPKPKINQPGLGFLENKKKSILQSLEVNSKSIKLYGLTVSSAKERDGLLKHLRATNAKIKELRGINQESSQLDLGYQQEDNLDNVVNRLPNRRREHTDFEEIPSKRMKDETSQSKSLPDPLAEIQKAVEPIIAETRRRVEQKIYEAMESGNLSSVLNALQNNPNLHDTLQKWEKGQQTQEDAGPSHRRPGHIEDNDYAEHSNTGPPPQRRPLLTEVDGYREHFGTEPPQKRPGRIEGLGYPEYSNTRPPQRHAEGRGYAEYSDAMPSQRRGGQIRGQEYSDYSEATQSQRGALLGEGSGYSEYYDEANVNEDFFDEPNLSYGNVNRNISTELHPPAVLQNVKRRGLLGLRPSLGMNSAPSRLRRYDAGW